MSKQENNVQTEENKVDGFGAVMGIIRIAVGIFLLYVGLQAFI